MCRWLPPELPQNQVPACCGPEPPRALLCFCWLPGLSSGRRACSVYCESFLGLCPKAHGVLPSLQGPLLRWLKVNFSEAFIAWIHIKALRVFVESVLRCVVGMLGWTGEWQGLEGTFWCSAPTSSYPPALGFLWPCLGNHQSFSSKESQLAMRPARQGSLFPARHVCSACITCVLPHRSS